MRKIRVRHLENLNSMLRKRVAELCAPTARIPFAEAFHPWVHWEGLALKDFKGFPPGIGFHKLGFQ